MAEATDGQLKYFVGVSVKVSGLEGPDCWSATEEGGCPLGCCCPPLDFCLADRMA